MTCAPSPVSQLAGFYGESSSLDRILQALAREGVEQAQMTARDLYSRDLDCHNLGAYPMLQTLAGVVSQLGAPGPGDRVLDVGCGLGGPGRFLADTFGCSVLGIDLLTVRVDVARALTSMTGLEHRVTYRLGDATRLPPDEGLFSQVWMLDVSVHVKAKQLLFKEIARVLRPGGHLVMHDQTAPIPDAMEPLTAHTPFFAPSLAQLLVYIEAAGMRLLAWQDTTQQVVAHFRQMKARAEARPAPADGKPRPWREHAAAQVNGYLETLANLGGRTGMLIAHRPAAPVPAGGTR
ncbi:MAG: sarcosine/dimethylglycine N-methyltransferase [Acidimicrobiia bacterium]|jgi:ubiquinone/menaquinone biosynthesis C-methylase UbiE|nr:sarcosine/dimethylglycine N-methyltransferase [Acidimicrobiia bacterium]